MAAPEDSTEELDAPGDDVDASALTDRVLDALDASRELVVFVDASARVVFANDTARRLFGFAEGRTLSFRDGRSPDSGITDRAAYAILSAIASHDSWEGELELQTLAAEIIPFAVTVQRLRDESGELVLDSVIGHDISELKHAQRLLRYQATHDALTGLPNRALFEEFGDQALARARRQDRPVAVLFLDIDHFKPVNDTHGHAAGDTLLAQLALRLRGAVRAGDLVARFGGDEFVVLCENASDASEMVELANRLVGVASMPFKVGDGDVRVSVSIGIASGAGPGVVIDQLLRDADAALYTAKQQGRRQAVLFGSSTAGFGSPPTA